MLQLPLRTLGQKTRTMGQTGGQPVFLY